MKKLLNDLGKFIKSQEKLILNANDIDIKNGNDRVEINEILGALDIDEDFIYYGKHKSKYKSKEYTVTNVYDNYGVVGIDCENNLIYPIIRAIAMCILTKNKVVINIKEGRNFATLNMIVILINKFLEVLKEKDYVKLVDKDNDFYRHNKEINKIFFISSHEYYRKNAIHTDVAHAYYNMSKPNVIITDKKLVKMLGGFKDNEIFSTVPLGDKLNYHLVKDLNDALDFINRGKENSKTVLFTSNEEEAISFMNNCKSGLTYVNIVSNNVSMPNFNQMDFLYIKSMISPN